MSTLTKRSLPCKTLVAAVMACALGAMVTVAHAQIFSLPQVLPGTSAAFGTRPAQGYLGVNLAELENERLASLKLKDNHGALITLIDHDAPAGQAGLRVNDVVLQLNGQPVESADQLRRQLREISAGRQIVLVVSRDGQQRSFTLILADKHVMEQSTMNRLSSGESRPVPGAMSLSGSGSDNTLPGGFQMPSGGDNLKIGAIVEPLTVQMADSLGITNGLRVKQVAGKSQAEAAGLKSNDVILKVGGDDVSTLADWDRSLRSWQGRQVSVTILREKKQQSVVLTVSSHKR